MGIFSLTKNEHSGENAGNIIRFNAKYSKCSPWRISPCFIIYRISGFTAAEIVHLTDFFMWHRTILKAVFVTEWWVSFLLQPVLPISGFIITCHSRSKGATNFFTTYFTTLIIVAVCKATEGKEHLLPCLWEGLRRRHDGNIAVSDRQIASSCVCIGNSRTKYLCLFCGEHLSPTQLGHVTFHSTLTRARVWG